jgi:hypothetical protein
MPREHFTRQGMNAWLDSPAGLMLAAQHGSRHGAAAALAQAEADDLTWRREQAAAKFERYPQRYESPSHAMADVPDPAGGGGAWLAGSTDEVVNAARRIDPTRGIRNLGGELPDGSVDGITVGPDRVPAPADTRPPWQRGD